MKEHDSAIVSFLHATTNNRELNSKQLVSYSLRAQVILISLFSYLWSHRMVLKPESGWTFSDAQCAVLRHFLKGMCCAVGWSYYDEHSPLFGWWEQPPSIEYLYFNLYTLKFSIGNQRHKILPLLWRVVATSSADLPHIFSLHPFWVSLVAIRSSTPSHGPRVRRTTSKNKPAWDSAQSGRCRSMGSGSNWGFEVFLLDGYLLWKNLRGQAPNELGNKSPFFVLASGGKALLEHSLDQSWRKLNAEAARKNTPSRSNKFKKPKLSESEQIFLRSFQKS